MTLRKSLSIGEVGRVLNHNRDAIMTDNKFSTVVLEFLSENYINPKDHVILENRMFEVFDLLF